MTNKRRLLRTQPPTKKPTIALDKKTGSAKTDTSSTGIAPSSATTPPQTNASGELRGAIKALDAERTELVKKTIENIKPGRPFDSSVVREINKLETKKNGLIVARFAFLLKKNPGEVQTNVHQIIEI